MLKFFTIQEELKIRNVRETIPKQLKYLWLLKLKH